MFVVFVNIHMPLENRYTEFQETSSTCKQTVLRRHQMLGNTTHCVINHQLLCSINLRYSSWCHIHTYLVNILRTKRQSSVDGFCSDVQLITLEANCYLTP
jgi:hypothetical protein